MPYMTVEERFWDKVERRGPGECWPWLASTRGSHVKHGQFWVPAGVLGNERGWLAQAHCVAFRFIHGRWPDPLGLHGCDNGICCNAVNLEHVHEGTYGENTQEMMSRGRWRGGCPSGVFAGELHPHAKFSDAQALDIHRRCAAGDISHADLAVEYDVSQKAISQIATGVRYTHLFTEASHGR
jgi:hypothetical protein